MAQGKILPSEIGLNNIKFDTALKLDQIQFWRDNYDNFSLRDLNKRKLLFVKPDFQGSDIIVGVKIIAKMLQKCLTMKGDGRIRDFDDHIKVAIEHLLIQEEHLTQNTSENYKIKLDQLMNQSKIKLKNPPQEVISLFCACSELDKIMSDSNRDRYKAVSDIIDYKKLGIKNLYLKIMF